MGATANNTNIEIFLRQSDLFRDLDAGAMHRVSQKTREQQVPRGTVLFNVGDEPTGLYLVVRGQIKLVFTTPNGREKIVELMGSGRSFGEALMFVTRPYPVRAQALADSSVLFVEKEALFNELRRDVAFPASVIASLSRRIHSLMADLEGHSMQSGTQRLIGFLLRGYEAVEEETGPIVIHLEISKTAVASRLNLTQEHLSRILHELISLDLIEVSGRAISVSNIDRLRRHGS